MNTVYSPVHSQMRGLSSVNSLTTESHYLVLWAGRTLEANRMFLDFQLGACKALNPSLVQLREEKETSTLNFVMP
jgi:hypothetical protein